MAAGNTDCKVPGAETGIISSRASDMAREAQGAGGQWIGGCRRGQFLCGLLKRGLQGLSASESYLQWVTLAATWRRNWRGRRRSRGQLEAIGLAQDSEEGA